MKVIDIKNNFSPELASKEAALALLKGRAVVYPTDTLYALGVNIFDTESIRKLFAIKKRPDKKPIPVMVGSISMAKAIAEIDEKREKVLRSFWPGTFTFILKKKPIVSYLLTAGRNTIALRIPDSEFCKMFVSDFEGPISVTSANISGEEPSYDCREIIERFEKEEIQPELIIDAGVLPKSDPSTIIDITGNMPKVLRISLTNKEDLMNILKKLEF
jgi:L-threonylcarbamoyladenylate synthase